MHIGKYIHKIVKDRRLTIEEFARSNNFERNNAYNIFKKTSIDTERLRCISKTLKFNFFQVLADDPNLSDIPSAKEQKNSKGANETSQFITVMPNILRKYGIDAAILTGTPIEIPGESPRPQHYVCLDPATQLYICFTIGGLLRDKPNCELAKYFNINRIKDDQTDVTVDLWESLFLPLTFIDIELDYKTNQKWEEYIKFILNIFSPSNNQKINENN